MIRFKKIELRNFMSFREAELEYPESGLVLVEGRNEDSETADSNWSGKTNLVVEALVWALFGQGTKEKNPVSGKGLQGSSPKDVIRDGCKQCRVILTLESGGREYRIERRRDKRGSTVEIREGNEVFRSSLAGTQERIQWLLGGMTYSTFVQSFVFSSGTARFSQATPLSRLEILEEILQLGVFQRAKQISLEESRDASKRLSELSKKLTFQNYTAKTLKSKIEDWQGSRKLLLDSLKSFEEERERDKKERKEELDRSIARRDWMLGEEREFLEKIENLKGESCSFGGVSYFLTDLESLRSKKIGCEVQRDDVRSRTEELKDILSNMERLDSRAACPTCRQMVDAKHLKKEAGSLREKILELEQSSDWMASEVLGLSRTIAVLDARKKKVDTLQESLRDCVAAIRVWGRRISEQTEALDGADKGEGIATDLQRQIDEQDKKLKVGLARLRKAKSVERSTKILEENARREQEDCRRLAHIFDSIRTHALETAIPTLEKTANGFAEKLLGGACFVGISPSDGLREGLSFDVIDGEGFGYHRASGGQRRRIDFCVSLALQQLNGGRQNLLILDEPFESLDHSGTEEVMNLLSDFVLREKSMTILVITHLSALRVRFQRVITVRRKDGVSSVGN